MTILVTGGAGYIGSHIVQGLVDRQQSVVVLDNLSTGFRQAVPSEVSLVIGEVGDEGLLLRLMAEHRIEAVMHFAASSVVPDSVANPIGYYNNNTAGSLALIKAAIQAGIRYFVFSSTAAVYGNPDTQLVDEAETARPMSPYGTSKLMTEIMLADTSFAHDFRYVALRYFNVAGADPKGRSGQSTDNATHLIKVTVQTALGLRKGMEVFGTDYPTPDGTCIRDYIHVCDLVTAHIEALEYLRSGGNSATLNCGYGHGYSVREVIDTVKRVSGSNFAVTVRPRRVGDPVSIVADIRAIRRVLSWTPVYDNLEAIVQHALAWERKLVAQK